MARFVIRKAIPVLAAVALSACATRPAVGPPNNELAPTLPPPQPSAARVIVFFADINASNYLYVPVSIDDETVGGCRDGGFNHFSVSPGRHVIDVMRGPKQTMSGAPTIQGASCPRNIELAGAATYFFEIQRSPQYESLHPTPWAFSAPFAIWGLIGIAVDLIGSSQGACIGPYSIEAIGEAEGLRKIAELHLTMPYVEPAPHAPGPPKLER